MLAWYVQKLSISFLDPLSMLRMSHFYHFDSNISFGNAFQIYVVRMKKRYHVIRMTMLPLNRPCDRMVGDRTECKYNIATEAKVEYCWLGS